MSRPALSSGISYFYPRPPRGGRPPSLFNYNHPPIFLSTPSARRATKIPGSFTKNMKISIHALREEGDCAASGRR